MIRMTSSRTERKVKLHRRKNTAWLKNLLKIDFYGDEDSECKKHRKKYKTSFCIDCISEPFCESCRLEVLRHCNHHVLQVEKCSRRAAIRRSTIGRLVTVTEIQPFKFNKHKVVFLQQRVTKGEPMCNNCGGHMLATKYKFCSIACQVEAQNEANPVIQSCSTQEAMKKHVARRTRKGIPVRSPFF